MSQRSDWLPGTRKGILAMAKEWIIVMMENGQAWGLAAGVLTKFTALTEAAETALAVVENDSTNTSVARAKCDEAFEALTADMRDTKRCYFLIPPLTIAGFVSLGLKPPDPTHTPGGTPTAQVITGRLTELGGPYRYRASAIHVEKATRDSVTHLDVRGDAAMRSMVTALANQKAPVKASGYGEGGTAAPQTA